MKEIEEDVSEDLGFRQLSGHGGVPLFKEPVDFSQNSKSPLQLLHVSHAQKLYAASNIKSVSIGHLSSFDEYSAESVIEDFVTVDFPGVSTVKFDASGTHLFALSEGQLFRAGVTDLLEKKTGFSKFSEYSDITALETAPFDNSFTILTSSGGLHICENGKFSVASEKVKGLCFSIDGSEVIAVQDLLVVVFSLAGEKKREYPLPDRGALTSVAVLSKKSYYVLGLRGEDEEDQDPETHTVVELSGELLAEALMLIPSFAEVDRFPTAYCAGLSDWIINETQAFLAYSLSTEISTVQCSSETQLLLPLNDTDRAELPMDDDGEDTLPVGFSLDVSGIRAVVNSPSPRIDEAKGVLPRLLCLNSQGKLLIWNIFHNSAVNSGNVSLERAQKLLESDNTEVSLKKDDFKDAQELKGGASKDSEEPEKGSTASPVSAASSGPTSFGAKTASGNTLSFGATGFGQSSFGQSSFGQSSFGHSAFGTKPAATVNSKLTTFGSGFGATSSTDSPFAKLASKNQSSDIFGGESAKKSIFGGEGANAGLIFGGDKAKDLIFGAPSKDTERPLENSTFGTAQPVGKPTFGGLVFGEQSTEQKNTQTFGTKAVETKPESNFEKPESSSEVNKKSAFGSFGNLESSLPNGEKKTASLFGSGFGATKKDASFGTLSGEIRKDSPFGALSDEAKKDPPFGALSGETKKDSSFGAYPKPGNSLVGGEKSNSSGAFGKPIFQSDSEKSPFSVLADFKGDTPSTQSAFGDFKLLKDKEETPQFSSSESTEESDEDTGLEIDSSSEAPETKHLELQVNPSQTKENAKGNDNTPFGSSLFQSQKSLVLPWKSEAKVPEKTATLSEKAVFGKAASEDVPEKTPVVEKAAPAPQKTIPEATIEKALETVETIKPVAHDGQIISDFILNAAFQTFGGFTKNPNLPEDTGNKMATEMILKTQANLDILDANLHILSDLFDAAVSGTEDDVSLKNIEEVLKKIPLKLGEVKSALEGYKARGKSMTEITENSALVEQNREAIERLLGQLAAFKQSIVLKNLEKRQLDVQAETLRLSVRKKLARVEDLQKQAMEKLVPLGVQANLGDLSKFETITHEIHQKTNIYAKDVGKLQLEMEALLLPMQGLLLGPGASSITTRLVAAERRRFGTIRPSARRIAPEPME